jgi:putative spermidine/putrescine transport system permease protein
MDRAGVAVSWLMLTVVLVFLLAPIVVVVGVSVSPSTVFDFPPDGFSLRWYQRIMQLDGFWAATRLSAEIALLATATSLVLGTLAAIAIVRGTFPGREALATFLTSPLMLPGLVVGIALARFFREFGLRDAFLSLLIAHLVVTMPFIMRTVLASLMLFDFAMIDAARTLGCSYPRALLKVLVPNLAPAFLSGGLFAFIISFDNYAVSIFLTDVRTKTLPIQMLHYLGESPDPTIAAISALQIVLTIVILILGDRLVGLRRLASM